MITLTSFTTALVSNKMIEKIIKDLWEHGQYFGYSDEIAKNGNTLFEFNDINNDIYLIKKEDVTEGMICIRTNHTPPFTKWSLVDKTLEAYDPSHKSVYEPITYAISLDKDLSVKDLRILEFKSEYALQIRTKSWLKQFVGYEGQRLRYGKDIDAVSGATISAKDLTADIEATYWGLRTIYGKLSNGPN